MTEFSIQDVQDGLVQLIAADESKKDCKKTFFFLKIAFVSLKDKTDNPPKTNHPKKKTKT